MIIASKAIFFIAIIFVLLQIIKIRRHALNQGVAIPTHIASVLIFLICILFVGISNFSPFHLLWMYPISLALGILLLFFPFFQNVTMILLNILTLPKGFNNK